MTHTNIVLQMRVRSTTPKRIMSALSTNIGYAHILCMVFFKPEIRLYIMGFYSDENIFHVTPLYSLLHLLMLPASFFSSPFSSPLPFF